MWGVEFRGKKAYFFLNQDTERRYGGFGEQFQVIKGDKQTKIPSELTGCGERTISQVIDRGGYGGVLTYFLDYDNVINSNEKTEEVIAREEKGFSEVDNYAIKSKQLVPIVRNALLHSFEKALRRSRNEQINRIGRSINIVEAYAEDIFGQIMEIGVHSNKLFPGYSQRLQIFPETNYEIRDFINALKEQFIDFSVYKLVLSGDRMDGRVFDRFNNLAKQD